MARDDLDAVTVEELIDAAIDRYGAAFQAIVPTCRFWVNGEPAEPGRRIVPGDEVAVLPPVSGG